MISKSYQIKKIIQERNGKKIFKTLGIQKRKGSDSDNFLNKNNRISS